MLIVSRQLWLSACAMASLAILTLGLHGSALNGFWRVDDPVILYFVSTHPNPSGYFFSLEVWRTLAVPFFTPWLALEYWIDLSLFGLNPSFFYAHHLFNLWVAACLTYVLIRRYVGWWWGTFGAGLFLIGAPTTVVAQQLMSRHYVTGLIFSIIAILLWLRGKKYRLNHMVYWASAFYLLAMLNKEVFAPLPLVLFALTEGKFTVRLRAILPLAVVAAIFVLWRSLMIGGLVGGYGNSISLNNLLGWLAVLPHVPAGTGWPLLLAGLVLALATAGLCYRSWRNLLILASALTGLALPFLALGATTDPFNLRFSFLPWWAASVLLSAGSARLAIAWQGSVSVLMAIASAVVATTVFTLHGREISDRASADFVDNFDAIGRFVWEHDESVSYVLPEGYPGNYTGNHSSVLSLLKQRHLKGSSPVMFPIAAFVLPGTKSYRYDPSCRCMAAIAAVSPDFVTPSSHFDLALTVDRRDGGLRLEAHSKVGGECILFFRDSNFSIRIPCAVSMKHYAPLQAVRGQFKLVLVSSGQWDASPWLNFPDRGEVTVWNSAKNRIVSVP